MENIQNRFDGDVGDVDIWFVACCAFSVPPHPKKGETFLLYFKQLPAKIDIDNDFKIFKMTTNFKNFAI